MDKFQPALPVPQGVQNGHVEGCKVSVGYVPGAFLAAARVQDAFDVIPSVQKALAADLVARLKAGEPVVLAADPFRQYRGPTAEEPVTLYRPAGSSGRL